MGIQFHRDRVALQAVGNPNQMLGIPPDDPLDPIDIFSLFDRDLPGKSLDRNIDTSASFRSIFTTGIDSVDGDLDRDIDTFSRGGSDVGMELHASIAV